MGVVGCNMVRRDQELGSFGYKRYRFSRRAAGWTTMHSHGTVKYVHRTGVRRAWRGEMCATNSNHVFNESAVDRSQPETPRHRPALLSLFCGPGGLDEGFIEAGFRIPLALDISQPAVATHNRNHASKGSTAVVADLSTERVEDLIWTWEAVSDQRPVGIIGGPPCQSFSVSNVHQRDDDPRHRLPEHYARILDGFNRLYGLDFFLFENVPGLLKSRHISRFEDFKRLCDSAGFRVYEQVIDAAHFGLPQYRPRVIVVGINNRHFADLKFSIPTGNSTAPPIDDYLRGLPEPVHNRPGLTPQDVPFHPNHVCLAVKSRKFAEGLIKPGEMWGRSFRALKWGEPSWTVAYGHREVHVHPDCHRRLSVYEAMLLQGFPHDYVLEGTLSQQITLVSEAVPPPVGKALGQAIIRVLYHQADPALGEIRLIEPATVTT